MTKTWGLVLGIVSLLIGILGFIPALVSDGGTLIGFSVGTVLNIIYIVVGVLVLGSLKREDCSAKTIKAVGVVYLLAAIIGFVQGETVLKMFDVNMATNLLHLVIAAVSLYVGFVGGSKGDSMGGAPSMPSVSAEPTVSNDEETPIV